MFKTDLSLVSATKKLFQEEGWYFMLRYVNFYRCVSACLLHYFNALVLRGIAPNTTAVAVPIAVTIFMTDILKNLKNLKYNAAANGTAGTL